MGTTPTAYFYHPITVAKTAGTTVTFGGVSNDNNLDLNGSLTLTSGILKATKGTIYLAANYTNNGGTFDPNAIGNGTVEFDGSNSYIDVNVTEAFYNLTFSGTAYKRLSADDIIIVTGTFNLATGSSYSESGTSVIRAQGNVVVGASYGDSYTSSIPIQFTGGAAQSFNMGATPTANFYHPITIAKTAGTAVTLANNASTKANITVTTGILNLAGYNLATTGTLTITDTLKLQGNESVTTPALGGVSTVEFTGYASAVTIPYAWSYKTLTLSGAGKTYKFTEGQTYTVATAFNVSGTAGNYIKLRSTTDGVKWGINVSGTPTVTYADVRDSDSTGTITTTYSINRGNNNANWVFNNASRLWLGGSTSWNTASNWTGGDHVPNSSETAVFDSTSTANCTLDANVDVYAMYILTGYSGTITQTTNSFTVGAGGLTINAGTLTHADNSTAETYKVNITVNGNFTLGAGGTINVDGKGYDAGYGPGKPISGNYAGGCYGGIGGAGQSGSLPGSTYGSWTAPNIIGSGGGCAAGGGSITITVTGLSTLAGTISASGASSYGGGSGGSIYLTTGTISGAGTISANGGVGLPTATGGGGGGRIALILTTTEADFSNFGDATVSAYGAIGDSSMNGAAGTIYKQTQVQGSGHGTLIIDNNDRATTVGITTAIPSGQTWDIYNMTLQNKGILDIGSGQTLVLHNDNISSDGDNNSDGIRLNGGTVTLSAGSLTIKDWSLIVVNSQSLTGNVTVQSGGNMTHDDNTTAETYKLQLTINGNLTIDSGGTINVDGKGYDAGYGPGKPTSGLYAGGSYGGTGGIPGQGGGVPGPTYGSVTAPTNLGSGANYAAGGGAVIINVTGESAISGAISANGLSSYGGASGGSIYLTTGTISGAASGSLTALGGYGMSNSTGGGGGGRISVILTASGANFSSYSGSMTAYGAAGDQNHNAAAGTVYTETGSQYAMRSGVLRYGDLTINNNNVSTASGVDTSISSQVTDTIVGTTTLTASKAGKLTINSGQSLTIIGTGTTLTIGSGTTLTNSGTLTMSGAVSSSGTITPTSGSTFVYTGDTTAVTIPALNYYTLTLSGAGKEFNFTQDQMYTATTAFNVTGGSIGSYIIMRSTLSGTQYRINTPTATITYADIKDAYAVVAMIANSSVNSGNNTNITFTNPHALWEGDAGSGDYNWSNVANWSGSMMPDQYTLVVFNSTHNVSCTIDDTVRVLGVHIESGYNGTLTQSGALTLGASGYSQEAGTYLAGDVINVSGDWTISGGTFTPGNGTVILDGNGLQNVTAGSSSFKNLTISNNSAQGINFTDAATVSGTVSLTGDETITGAPTMSANSTVEYTATSGSREIQNWGYKNLKINGANGAFKLPANMDIPGVDVAAGTLDLNGKSLTVTGAFTVDGTLRLIGSEANVTEPTLGANSVVEYYATSGVTDLRDWAHKNLNLNGVGGTFRLTADNSVTNMNILAGTFDLNGKTITVNGSWTNGDQFTANSGKVIFATVADANISGDNEFADLECKVAGKTLNFIAGDIQTITGKLTLEGAAGDDSLIKLRSSASPTQWEIEVKGTDLPSMSYIDVKDSKNLGTTAFNPLNSKDSGNNTNWFYTPPTPSGGGGSTGGGNINTTPVAYALYDQTAMPHTMGLAGSPLMLMTPAGPVVAMAPVASPAAQPAAAPAAPMATSAALAPESAFAQAEAPAVLPGSQLPAVSPVQAEMIRVEAIKVLFSQAIVRPDMPVVIAPDSFSGIKAATDMPAPAFELRQVTGVARMPVVTAPDMFNNVTMAAQLPVSAPFTGATSTTIAPRVTPPSTFTDIDASALTPALGNVRGVMAEIMMSKIVTPSTFTSIEVSTVMPGKSDFNNITVTEEMQELLRPDHFRGSTCRFIH